MSLAAAVKSVYRQYAGFEGRARRAEFWYFYLFEIIVMIPLYAIGLILIGLGGGLGDSTTDTSTPPTNLPLIIVGSVALMAFGLFALVSLIPRLAVTVRRLHDTGRSGWWILISYVPFVGGILLLVWLAGNGQYGPNRFGADPKNPAAPGPAGYAYPVAPIGGPQHPSALPQQPYGPSQY